MGIQGLLPFLKKCSREANLRDFKGWSAAIDAYCWLHKGAFSCADKLVRGEATDGYVVYIMRQINLLLNNGIKPIMVFDGCHLPSKAGTELKRRENREKNRKKAKELLREGKAKEARECFQRCVDVTSEMAADVIRACRERNVDVIVAPYEADSQLAFLNLSGLADLVITEDSDLVLFGCKRVLFKMDNNGGGILVEQEKLHISMNVPRDKFTFDKFLNMCILSGCDYLPSLPGIGLAKACKFFTVTSNPDIHNVLCKIPAYLKMPQLEVTKEYRDGFMQARNTFHYQLVFDPVKCILRPLLEYPDGKGPEDYPYAGKFVGHERALQIALGNVNVQTGETVDYFNPETYVPPPPKSSGWDKKGNICSGHKSIWSKGYTPVKPGPAVPSILPTERPSTLGKVKSVPLSPVLNRKRKLEAEDDQEPTEDELQSMYSFKRIKSEDVAAEEDLMEGESALAHLAEGLDAEEEKTSANDSVGNVSGDGESEISPPPVKSKNPFAKSVSGGTTANKGRHFSALNRFSKIKKSLENSNTIVQSRYFSSSAPKIKNEHSDKVKDAQDAEERLHEVKKEEKAASPVTQNISVSCDESQTSGEIKAPLSPVQENILRNEKKQAFKWGKLSMFAHHKDKVKIESSPASKDEFKAVFKTEDVKENNPSSVQNLNNEFQPLSQSSAASERSAISDVGSIDNESFGLTPSSQNQEPESPPEPKVASPPPKPSNVKTPPSNRSSSMGRSRGVGLSRRGGGAKQKDRGTKQLSLKDMFGFKKEAAKLQHANKT